MKQFNRSTGTKGESLASEFLADHGYLILERNFRTKFGELDLICRRHDLYVFVEVKAKVGYDFGIPEDMITPTKLSKVRRMAEVYLQINNLYAPCRIDVVAIVFDTNLNVISLKHYENVY